MRLLARLRLFSAHHPWLRWLVVAAASGICAITLTRALHRLEAARESWGDTVLVVVAQTELQRGATIGPGDTDLRRWPRALIPAAVVTEPPVGLVVWQRVAKGQVLVHHDVAAPDDLAARLPPGTSGISVPVGLLPVGVGDRLDVVVDGRVGATGMVVEIMTADIVGRVAVVAVAESDAAPLAAAAAEGRVVLVLSATPPQQPPG